MRVLLLGMALVSMIVQTTMRKVKRIALDAMRAAGRRLVRAHGVGRAIRTTGLPLHHGQRREGTRAQIPWFIAEFIHGS